MMIVVNKTNGRVQGWTGVKTFRYTRKGLFICDAYGEFTFIPRSNIVSFKINQ